MDSDNERSSSARKWWLLIGVFVLFVVGFGLLEKLVRPDAEGSAPEGTQTTGGSSSPRPPQVHRLEDGAIEIRHDFLRHTTIRMQDEDAAQALFDCLSRGFEQTLGDGTEGWKRRRVRREARRIQDECMGSHGMALPVPPPAPDSEN